MRPKPKRLAAVRFDGPRIHSNLECGDPAESPKDGRCALGAPNTASYCYPPNMFGRGSSLLSRVFFAWQLNLRRVLACTIAAVLLQDSASAQAPTKNDQRDTVVVVASAPLDQGTRAESVPAAINRLDESDLTRTGTADILGAMNARLGGVTLNQAQANPFQPNLLYRGFEASPLPGNPQGLAIFLDGSRFNQPFGDTVDWDLIPDMAVSALDVVASNPAFGLNALGGAISVHLKNGFGHRGGSAEISAGSFGRKRAGLQYGGGEGPFAVYTAVTMLDDDGWRDFSPSKLRQGYADFGWKGERRELHANLILADNELTGNGAAPVQLLAFDRSAVFTHPDTTHNKYGRFAINGDWDLSDAWRLRVQVYGARLDRKTVNGDAGEVEPCDDDDDILCSSEDDDVELIDVDGDAVENFITGSPYADYFPDFSDGGPYAFLNHTEMTTTSYGASAQATRTASLFGLKQRLSAGASFDGAKTKFNAGTTIGGLSLDRGWFGPGIELDTPDANISPVSLHVRSEYWGVFASDAIEFGPGLLATITARANQSHLTLSDQLGTALDGDHTFRRIDPALGLSWRPIEGLSIYGGYSETSRAPTPAELSCADPEAPCSLTNFFVADPPLKQVVGRTLEAGARGSTDITGLFLTWHAGVYRTDVDDDIQMVASTTAGRAYFTNVGRTRRQGAELGLSAETDWFEAYADYAWTDATYQTHFDLNAAANPAFNEEDDIMTVEKGDRRPGIPAHSFKVGFDWFVNDAVTIGVDSVYSSGRYLAGDEANLNSKTGDFAIANAHLKWKVRRNLELFAEVENLFDTNYETFGAFSPVEAVPVLELGKLADPRALSPGMRRAAYAGLRVRF